MDIDKIIFVHSPHDNVIGGLPIIDKRNKFLLTSFTKNVVDIPVKEEKCIGNRFYRYACHIKAILKNHNVSIYRKICQEVDEPMNTVIFISHSTYGTIIKDLKKKYPALRIVCFFHNVEITMAYNRLKFKFHKGHLYEWVCYYMSEVYSIKYSDVLLVLNNRDRQLLHKFYRNTKEVFLFPTSLKDRCPDIKLSLKKRKLNILFVGTYFWGNIPGILDFIKEVMPQIDAHLYVVGNKMECLIPHLPSLSSNVEIVGKVSDEVLDEYYKNADIFIAPINSGGGMKTKVAEAMMFGLPVIGTSEAFCGYDIDISSVGYRADSSEDFIQFIKELDGDRKLLFEKSQKARLLFEEKYSIKSSLSNLESIFNLK